MSISVEQLEWIEKRNLPLTGRHRRQLLEDLPDRLVIQTIDGDDLGGRRVTALDLNGIGADAEC